MMEMVILLHTIFIVIIIQDFLNNNKSGLFHPFVWVAFFHILVFWLKPVISYFLDFHFAFIYMEINPSFEDKVKALAVADLWFFSMYFGMRSSFRYEIKYLSIVSSKSDRLAAVYTFLIVLPIALYSIYSTFSGVSIDGREGSILMERIDGIAININSNGYINDAKHLFVGLIVLAFGVWGFNKYTLVFLFLFILDRAYQGWGRWAIVFSLISVGMLWLYKNQFKTLPKRFIAPAILLFCLFNILGQNREVVKEIFMYGEVTNVVEQAPSFGKGLDNLDFANYEYLVYIVSTVPDYTDTYSYGTQYLQLFTEPIPRSIWPEKPIGQPIKLFDLNDYGNFIGLTHSMAGDAWISLGWIGVFFLPLLFSMIISRYFIKFVQTKNLFVVFVFIAASPLLSQWFRDGGIVSIVKFFAFSLLPLILWNFLRSFTAKRGRTNA